MRWARLACVFAFAATAHAADEPAKTEAQPLLPLPQGYEFDHPDLLADQHLWGIAHGARLLALTCARHGHAAAAEAWVDWHEREAEQIGGLTVRLGRHYFQREDVPLDAITLALGLRQSLDLPPELLESACNTFAEALAQPRYDLARRREEMLKK